MTRIGLIEALLGHSLWLFIGGRCLNDNDDEVRDRATFYLSMLEKQEALSKDYITGGALPRLFIPKSRSILLMEDPLLGLTSWLLQRLSTR